MSGTAVLHLGMFGHDSFLLKQGISIRMESDEVWPDLAANPYLSAEHGLTQLSKLPLSPSRFLNSRAVSLLCQKFNKTD